MDRPRIAISTKAAGATLKDAAERLSRCGFRYAELSIEHASELMDQPESAWSEAKKMLKDQGIALKQGHLRNQVDLGLRDANQRAQYVEVEKKWLDLFAVFNIEIGVIHPGGWEVLFEDANPAEVRANQIDSLLQLTEHARNTSVRLAVESMPDTAFNAQIILDLVNSADINHTGICLDTGHLHLTHTSLPEFVRTCGGKLFALHLHDNSGPHFTEKTEQGYWYHDDLHVLPMFSRHGVDWTALSAALKEIGYEGLYSFEVSWPGLPPEGLESILRFTHELGTIIFR